MAPRPTVIGTQGYRRGLASLSVVKELVLPSPSECPGRLFYGRPFLLDRLAVTPNQLARDLSGGTYPAAFPCSGFVGTTPEPGAAWPSSSAYPSFR